MEKSRILIADKKGSLRKILSFATYRDKAGLNIYFFFPKEFSRLVNHTSLPYNEVLIDQPWNLDINFKELHLRYPPDGKVHISLKGSADKPIIRSYTQHKLLSDLTAKLLFTIIPKAPESYPVYNKTLTPLDWVVKDERIPEFFYDKPIRLNFWIGSGDEKSLFEKGKGIEKYEILNTLRFAQIFHGLDDVENIQIFMAVSRPKELEKFPDVMSIFLHSNASPSLKRISS